MPGSFFDAFFCPTARDFTSRSGFFHLRAKSVRLRFSTKNQKSEDFKHEKINHQNYGQRQRKGHSSFPDDETAKVLEECGDEELKHRYIVEEYKDKLIERRETRRHQSLEKSIESGHEFVDHKADVEQNLEKKEEIEQLYKALKFLTKKQMYVLRLHVLEQKTFQEISEIMGINLYTVYEHYVTAKKKLKKFFD